MDKSRRKIIKKGIISLGAGILSLPLINALQNINFSDGTESMKMIRGSSGPTISTNPGEIGIFYLNETSGEVFVITDATSDSNVWISTGTGTTSAIQPIPGATVTLSTLTNVNAGYGIGIKGESFYNDSSGDSDLMWGIYGTGGNFYLLPITFNSSTKQFSVGSSIRTMEGSGWTSASRSAVFSNRDKLFWAGYQDGDPSGHAWHADLNIFDNITSSTVGSNSGSLLGGTAADREFYISPYRLGDDNCVVAANSNYCGQIHYYSAKGGVSYTRSAKYGGSAISADGGGSTNSFDKHRVENEQICRIGYSTGSNKERGPDAKKYCWINSGSDGGSSENYQFLDTTNYIDLITEEWNGSSGTTPTETEHSNLITLPTHTGSTTFPDMICTSWGNLVIHKDTATPANSKLFAITWSGSPGSPTVSANQVWSSSVPINEILWKAIDGYGSMANPLFAAEREGETDVWNTIRVYNDGTHTYLDTIKISVDSSCNHTVTTLRSALITFSNEILTPTSFTVMHVRNTYDAIIVVNEANSRAYYVEYAFY